jgi:cell division protein FtsI (penicillin-binding protein 3)
MNRQATSAPRERVIILAILTATALIVVRLVSIQVFGHNFWESQARAQETAWIKQQAVRGDILDRAGRPLAISLPLTYAIGYRPERCPDKTHLLEQIQPLLRPTQKDLKKRLAQDVTYTYLARRVDWETAEKLKALDLPCLEFVEEPCRSHPNNDLAASVIGFTDIDQAGQEGIELEFDSRLRGSVGRELVWLGTHGQPPLALSADPEKTGRGADVELTIDIPLQTIVEEELHNAMRTQECLRACILLTDPRSGEILALATYPSFNPDKPGASSVKTRKCWPITDVMEHGSTLKIVPFAGALSDNLFASNEVIFCENGRYRVPGATIHDAHSYDHLTFAEVLHKSSNIGAAKVAQRLGKRGLYETARSLGFGAPTGISFPGEQAGRLLPPHKWSGPSLATMAFGHGFSASPLQVAMAYGAIANGGLLMKPLLVKAIYHPSGEIEESEPTVIRRALSPEVARQLTNLLVGVIENGTGKAAAIEGWRIAGKTGTGQKIDFDKRRYYADRFISSFVGFVPAEAPCYLMLVLLDDPRGQYYGAEVAAPIFRNAMTRILECRPPARPVSPSSETNALANGNSQDLNLSGDITLHPEPRLVERTTQPANKHAALVLAIETKGDVVQVPAIEGLSIRRAIRELTTRKLAFEISGGGQVICQSPSAGSMVPVGTVCYLLGMND